MAENGSRVWREMKEVDTSEGAHRNWPDRFFARLVDTYLARTSNRGGRVGAAQCYLVDARGLHQFAERVMMDVASNPATAASLVP
jgi:aminoglycoside N3'-acetyltransferase